MKKYLFLFGILVLTIGFVFSESCNTVGEISNGSYCDSDGQYKPLKSGGGCFNDFECMVGVCVEDLCQSKYISVEENTNIIRGIWTYFSGEECDPNYDTNYKCEGEIAFLCGANFVWEEKGRIQGVCGVNDIISGGNSGGGGSGGSGGVQISVFSPKNITYGGQLIPLQVIDLKKVARYWKYSLNGENSVLFSPNTTILAKVGANTIDIFSSRYNSFISFDHEKISFSVRFPEKVFCGNNVCDEGENSESCVDDCGSDNLETSYCGDNFCDSDESSATCIEDCQPAARENHMWLFYTLVVFLISGIFVLGFVVTKRILLRLA